MDATYATPAAKHAATGLSAKHPAAASSSAVTAATRNAATRSMARRSSAMNIGAPDTAGESHATTGQRLAAAPAVSSASSAARVSTRQATVRTTRAMPATSAKQATTTRSESPLNTTPITAPNPSGEDHDGAGEDTNVDTGQQLTRASSDDSARQAPPPRFSPPQPRPAVSAVSAASTESAPRTASPPVLPKPRPRVSIIEDTADATSSHGPPVPVVPALKKKAKGAVKKRTAG